MTDTMSLAELDKEIERLQEEKERVEALLQNPEESSKRRARRGIAFGRWLETMAVTPEQMVAVQALADEVDRWLFGEEVLIADGWLRDPKSDNWNGPSVGQGETAS